jgi:hypothetical protein
LLAVLRHLEQEAGAGKIDSSFSNIHWEIRSADPNVEVPSGLVRSLLSPIKEVPIQKHRIAIIWDMDTLTEVQRIEQCNNAIQLAIIEIMNKSPDYLIKFDTPLSAAGHFTVLTVNSVSVEIGAYFINHNGSGEMEDLLKAIKTQPSPIADCVDTLLPDCLAQQNQNPPRDKDLVKLWMNHYIRYDTLLPHQRKAAHTKWQHVMEKRANLFDFGRAGITGLDALKHFLVQLCA